LDAVAAAPGEIGTNELARRTGVNASTVSRLLASLAAAGLVDHDAASGRYRLGMRMIGLGNAVLSRLDLRALARPHLEALVDETGETATLSMSGEPDAITVDFVQSPSSVQSVATVGRPSIAHATATGKVLLAFGREHLPRGPLRAFTARTITTRVALRREVERVRKRGYAEAVGEREVDLSAIAAPVLDATNELAAIVGLQGPSSRFDGTAREAALPTLTAHAQALSRSLGSS
jgi:IclR family acetate operon transcriptional repressor